MLLTLATIAVATVGMVHAPNVSAEPCSEVHMHPENVDSGLNKDHVASKYFDHRSWSLKKFTVLLLMLEWYPFRQADSWPAQVQNS